jgi:serine/threonine protein kinase
MWRGEWMTQVLQYKGTSSLSMRGASTLIKLHDIFIEVALQLDPGIPKDMESAFEVIERESGKERIQKNFEVIRRLTGGVNGETYLVKSLDDAHEEMVLKLYRRAPGTQLPSLMQEICMSKLLGDEKIAPVCRGICSPTFVNIPTFLSKHPDIHYLDPPSPSDIAIMLEVAGESLNKRLKKDNNNQHFCLRLEEQIRERVDAMYRIGIVYQDFKTDNFVIDDDNKVLLIDFDRRFCHIMADKDSDGLEWSQFQVIHIPEIHIDMSRCTSYALIGMQIFRESQCFLFSTEILRFIVGLFLAQKTKDWKLISSMSQAASFMPWYVFDHSNLNTSAKMMNMPANYKSRLKSYLDMIIDDDRRHVASSKAALSIDALERRNIMVKSRVLDKLLEPSLRKRQMMTKFKEGLYNLKTQRLWKEEHPKMAAVFEVIGNLKKKGFGNLVIELRDMLEDDLVRHRKAWR